MNKKGAGTGKAYMSLGFKRLIVQYLQSLLDLILSLIFKQHSEK